MPKKVYCPKCQQKSELVRIIYYGNCTLPERFKILSDKGEIILRRGAAGSDALYATKCCKIGLPKYGTFDEWISVVRSDDKKSRDEFFKKEKQLVGVSYVEEIL